MIGRFYVTQPLSQPYLVSDESDKPPRRKQRAFAGSDIEYQQELRDKYPIAFRNVIKKVVPAVIGVVLIGLVLFLLHFDIGLGTPADQIQQPLEKAVFVVGGFLVIFAAVKFIYESLYRYTYSYGVHDGHFFVSKGVILKRRGSFPLARITDVYLDRSFFDLLFGLYNLHISTPTTASGQFARIEGLGKSTAHELQRHLGRLMEYFQSHVNESESSPYFGRELRYSIN